MLLNQTVRFFINAYDENDDYDAREVTEECFDKIQNKLNGIYPHQALISYVRNTVFENGVNQICLTLSSDSIMIYESELDLV